MSPAFYFGSQALKSTPGQCRCNPISCTDALNLHKSFSQTHSQIVCECTVADLHADTDKAALFTEAVILASLLSDRQEEGNEEGK